MADISSMNVDDSLNKFRVPKDILEVYEDSRDKIQKWKLLFEIKQLPKWSIKKENKDVLATEKLVSDLRDVFRFKELHELYIRFPIEQLKNSDDPTAKQLLNIKSTIEKSDITLKSDTPQKLSIGDFVKLPSSTVSKSEQSESEQSEGNNKIQFSKKEQKRVKDAYEKVTKLVNNYNNKDKEGKSRTIVHTKAPTNNDIPSEILKIFAIIIFLANYYGGCKGSTKLIQLANKARSFIKKYSITIPETMPDYKTKKNLIIPMPEGFENTTYLGDLGIILERNKEQYEKALKLIKELEATVKKRNIVNSITIRDIMRKIDKLTNILENFVPTLKKFMAENPRYSKLLESKVKKVMNLYEGLTKMDLYFDLYKEIEYSMYFGDTKKVLLTFNKETKKYGENIYKLIITATKSKSIGNVSKRVNILYEDYENIEGLKKNFEEIKKIAISDKVNDMTHEEALKFERQLRKLAVKLSKVIGPLQSGMEKLQEILENQKQKDSIYSKVKELFTFLGLIANLAASVTATVNGII